MSFTLLALFFFLGMPWVSVAALYDVKIYQLLFVAVLAQAFLTPRIRGAVLGVIGKNVLLLYFSALFTAYMVIAAVTAQQLWSVIDVLQFFLYVLVSLVFAGVVVERGERSVGFSAVEPAVAAILGFASGLLITFGSDFPRLFTLAVHGIQSGDPGAIIFDIFGKTAVTGVDDGSGIAGQRHTTAMWFSVLFALLSRELAGAGLKFRILGPWAVLLILIALIQSRSSWLVVGLTCVAWVVSVAGRARLTARDMALGAGSILVALPIVFGARELLLKRLTDVESADARKELFLDALTELNSIGLFPLSYTKEFPSAHNFVVNAGLSGGWLGAAIASCVFLVFMGYLLKGVIYRVPLFVVAGASAVLVRMVTSGQGLPGGAVFLGFGLLLAMVTYPAVFGLRVEKGKLHHDHIYGDGVAMKRVEG